MDGTGAQTNKGSLQFQVDNGLLFQLGEQLVDRRSIALAELIKNSYDADATKVEVLFENVTKPHGAIIISDNGTGMTLSQIINGWMKIGGSEKSLTTFSPNYNRPLTGAKGVGRFAARRISRKLTLSTVGTRDDGTKEKVNVDFDWEGPSFKAGKLLSDTDITYISQSVGKDTPTGVTLYLEDCRDIWTEEDAYYLQQDLLSLQSPFSDQSEFEVPVEDNASSLLNPGKHDPGFTIEFISEEFQQYNGQLNSNFLDTAYGMLTGRVDKEGIPHYKLTLKNSEGIPEFIPALGETISFKEITYATLEVHYFVYSRERLDPIWAVRDASRYGKDNGGIRLYLDHFRVFPYGEPDNDWLGLDRIRASRNTTQPFVDVFKQYSSNLSRPLLLIPGNNQVFGAINVSRVHHPEIQLTIGRERLIENAAYEQLKEFVLLGVYWLTIQYAKQLADEARKRVNRVSTLDTVNITIKQAEEVISNSSTVSEAQKVELMESIARVKQITAQREEELISELSVLRILASAGTMVIMFSHQIRAIIDEILGVHTDLLNLREEVSLDSRSYYEQLLGQLDDWRERVQDQAQLIGFLVGRENRQRKRRLALKSIVDDVTRALQSYSRKFNIDVVNEVPPDLRTPPMYESEIFAVVLNIFTNALKAVKEQSVRKISITAQKTDRGVYLTVLDTGYGIERAKREDVFRAFSTTGKIDPILGVGTGLGLKVVRDLLATYGGAAKFVDAPSSWVTAIELFIPKEF